MRKRLQDNMGISKTVGNSDIFVTMTFNPNYPEIKRHIAEGQTVNCRPDIVSHVFRMKMKHMMSEGIDSEVFGSFDGYVSIVEF